MKSDVLKQFSRLRNSLVQERTRLEERLAQINEVIGNGIRRVSNGSPKTPRRQSRRRRRGLSLRQAILKVISVKPLTKEEILEAVKKLGYKFSTSKPIGSINACLYQKGAFKNRNGRFSPGKKAQ